MPKGNNDELTATIVGIILFGMIFFGAIIIASCNLLPTFFWGMILFAVLFLILLFVHLFFFIDEDWMFALIWIIPLALCFIFGAGTFVTYKICYEVSQTSLGQGSLDLYNTIANTQEELNNAINQAIENSCEAMTEEQCNLLKQNIELCKDVQDVANMANKIKKGADIANKIAQ